MVSYCDDHYLLNDSENRKTNDLFLEKKGTSDILSLSLSRLSVCLFCFFLKYEEPILGPVVFPREHIIANLLCSAFF